MKKFFGLSVMTVALSAVSFVASAQQEVPAVLEGHAILPANSVIQAPDNAPADLKIAGKYTNRDRVEALGSIMGKSNGRETGHKVPFKGQPLQGHSGIQVMDDGSVWIVTDNGFGNKANSPDSMLYANHYNIDWKSGEYKHQGTVFLSDPNKKVPFRIVHEDTKERYLTGSDFDLESMQIIGDHIWFGEEFGPFLIKADKNGHVVAVFETELEGKKIHSPDNYKVATPGAPGETYKTVNLKRSKGYEGMASSVDGKFLYPLLEGPVWDEKTNDWEKSGDKTALRVLEFDVAAEKWTGRSWFYPLEAAHHAIGDFNMIDATTGLIIERDNGEGTPDKACKEGEDPTKCFADLPKFKRIYKVEFTPETAGKEIRKIAYIDLLNIQDPNKLARKPLSNGVFQFPFFTIENVDVIDGERIVVGNDNNYPFSSSREPNQQDDNELILLNVKALLQAK